MIPPRARAECEALLQIDPWDWRAVWMTGVAAMAADDVPGAVSSFNAVYGQVPGELAPKLALARACELADEREMATGLYAVCSRTDGAYLAAAQFGLARLAQADGRTADALAALGRIPPVSRAYGEARRQRASLLVGDGTATPDDLAAASLEVERAGLPPRERTALHVEILEAALATTVRDGDQPSTHVVGVTMTEPDVRRGARVGLPVGGAAERRPGRADRVGRPGQHRATAHAHMSEATTSTLEACPACGQAIAAGDVFCESCGAELEPTAAVEAAPDDADLDDTQPVEIADEEPPPGAIVCPSCGGTQFEDGFCTTCGTKQPSWRDHFTEAPTELVAGVCDKGVGRSRNEDAMAMAVVGERTVLVVCDGVTSAPDSDRASLAAARAARDVLAAAPAAPPGIAAAVGHWTEQLVSACAAANQEAVRRRPDTRQPARAALVHVRRGGGRTIARHGGVVWRLPRLLAARTTARRGS